MDSHFPVTKSAVQFSGLPLDSVEEAISPNSPNAGEPQRISDGEHERIRMESGNTLAPITGKKIKLGSPPSDLNARPEHGVFLYGFTVAIEAVMKALGVSKEETLPLIDGAKKLADLLYPPFDPLPDPAKRGEDGRRKDGIAMENKE